MKVNSLPKMNTVTSKIDCLWLFTHCYRVLHGFGNPHQLQLKKTQRSISILGPSAKTLTSCLLLSFQISAGCQDTCFQVHGISWRVHQCSNLAPIALNTRQRPINGNNMMEMVMDSFYRVILKGWTSKNLNTPKRWVPHRSWKMCAKSPNRAGCFPA